MYAINRIWRYRILIWNNSRNGLLVMVISLCVHAGSRGGCMFLQEEVTLPTQQAIHHALSEGHGRECAALVYEPALVFLRTALEFLHTSRSYLSTFTVTCSMYRMSTYWCHTGYIIIYSFCHFKLCRYVDITRSLLTETAYLALSCQQSIRKFRTLLANFCWLDVGVDYGSVRVALWVECIIE